MGDMYTTYIVEFGTAVQLMQWRLHSPGPLKTVPLQIWTRSFHYTYTWILIPTPTTRGKSWALITETLVWHY